MEQWLPFESDSDRGEHDLRRVRLGHQRLHSESRKLLWRLWTEAESRRRPIDRLPAVRPPAGSISFMYLPVVGPLARSAGDLRTALNVTAGPEDQSTKAYTWDLPSPRRTRLKDYRIGFVLDHDRAPVVSDIFALLSETVDVLDRAGRRWSRDGPRAWTPPNNMTHTSFIRSSRRTPRRSLTRGSSSSTIGACWLVPLGPTTSTTSTCSCAL